jgi:hypothetical protein
VFFAFFRLRKKHEQNYGGVKNGLIRLEPVEGDGGDSRHNI